MAPSPSLLLCRSLHQASARSVSSHGVERMPSIQPVRDGPAPGRAGLEAVREDFSLEQRRNVASRNRQDLILHHMARADESATQLRALLIAIGVATGGYLYNSHHCNLLDRGLPILLIGLALVVLYLSWAAQKAKSLCRVELLRSGRFHDYASYGGVRNRVLDAIAAILLGAAMTIEAFSSLIHPGKFCE